MRTGKATRAHGRQPSVRRWIMAAVFVAFCLLIAGVWWQKRADTAKTPSSPSAAASNPIQGRTFYTDNTRAITKLAAEYQTSGAPADARALKYVAGQPGTTWLTGPTVADQVADRDIRAVERTSSEAAMQGTLPIYQLYALPNRDACAVHSKGGFTSTADYMAWVDRIVGALKTDAVMVVEADAIAHTINSGCMNAQQIEERYALLKKVVLALKSSPRVVGIYLDAGHPDWLPDPSVLVEPLRRSGLEYARGVAVNVSFFAETSAVTPWAQQLVARLGGNKGVIIDTSRNGRGIAPLTGDAKWCNPPGRGVGLAPATQTGVSDIDAYFWGKNIGESDGACNGRPAAGVFVPEIAIELARNAPY